MYLSFLSIKVMSKELVKFSFGEEKLTTFVDEQGRDWFRGTEVCKILKIANPSVVIKREADEYWQELKIGMGRPALYVSEPGLYSLIFASKSPMAKKFKRWVFEEVLPKLRRTGEYSHKSAIAPSGSINLDFELQEVPDVLDYLVEIQKNNQVNKDLRSRLIELSIESGIQKFMGNGSVIAVNKPRVAFSLKPDYELCEVEHWALSFGLNNAALKAVYKQSGLPEAVEAIESPCFYVSQKYAQMQASL